MQPVPDPYRALGVARGATEAEIKAAHRKLAKRYHPDGSGGDTKRFLSVQEAYRVLSDPLLRRDWDAKHAGPMRATQPAPAKSRTARSTRRAAGSTRSKTAPPPDAGEAGADQPRPEADPSQPASARPRSSRAYTWSASEVPWWEEGTAAREKKRAQNRRRRSSAASGGSGTAAGDEPTPGPAQADTPHDFDVYNRSSGAAWSMAARAYFRRGDQDLPSRGSFQYQGTQVLTAARARAAAEAEARQQAARAAREQQATPPRQSAKPPAPQPAYAYASAGVARDPVSVGRAREQFLKRLRAQHWPNLKERLLYALVAWLPIAVLIAFGGTVGAGCDSGPLGCPPQVELAQAGLIGLALLAFVLLPKLAYFGALGTLGMLVAAAASVTVIAFVEAPLPLSIELVALVGGAMLVGYFVSAGIAAARGGPWRVGQR
ncbi:MAG TPA: DnaJ domain-containing protein [Candidatus Limnocylindrales bacterium]|nr:DnaJ domain-containing protein [Candidatus Limnocylindrales bacterium]